MRGQRIVTHQIIGEFPRHCRQFAAVMPLVIERALEIANAGVQPSRTMPRRAAWSPSTPTAMDSRLPRGHSALRDNRKNSRRAPGPARSRVSPGPPRRTTPPPSPPARKSEHQPVLQIAIDQVANCERDDYRQYRHCVALAGRASIRPLQVRLRGGCRRGRAVPGSVIMQDDTPRRFEVSCYRRDQTLYHSHAWRHRAYQFVTDGAGMGRDFIRRQSFAPQRDRCTDAGCGDTGQVDAQHVHRHAAQCARALPPTRIGVPVGAWRG